MGQFCKRLELDPAFPQAQRYAAWAYLQKGMHQEAIASLRAALGGLGRNPEVEGDLGYGLGVAGRRGEALATLQRWRQRSAARFASPHSHSLGPASLRCR